MSKNAKDSLLRMLKTKEIDSTGYGQAMWKLHRSLEEKENKRKQADKNDKPLEFKRLEEVAQLFSQDQPVTVGSSE